MRRITLLFIFAAAMQACFAQEFSMPYAFDEKPDFTDLVKGYDLKTVDELEVLDERTIEYAYDRDGSIFEFFYVHVVKYVNSEDAIDRNNKIYVALSRVKELIAYDARVITEGKKAKALGKDALKEGANEDGETVRFFAVSGAEKGSFIEYYYLVKRGANVSGTYLTFQENIPTAKSVFRIISPANLVFATRSLNGYAKMAEDSSMGERNYLKAETLKIPKIENENFANEGANKMKVVYQLYLNRATGKKNIYNYGMLSQTVFESIDKKPSKDAMKGLEKILKNCNIKSVTGDENRIIKIEDYVKSNFEYVNSGDDRFDDLESIFKLRTFNSLGATRLLYQLYELAGIEREIVITSSRYAIRFDPDFESWAYLNEYLLYFPSVKKIMSPAATMYRLGIVPYGYIENNGLFIKKVTAGDVSTGAGKVKFMPAYPAEHTQHNMTIHAQINSTHDSLDVRCRLSFTGYYAQQFQPGFDFVPKDKIKETEHNIVKTVNENITIKTVEVENKGASNVMVNPFVVNATFSSAHFIDKAGSKILLRFGDLIGPQSELYQEKDRQLPVENDYNRVYNRELNFTVPEGYRIKNAEELKMAVQPFLSKGDGAGFTSAYTLTGNKLEVKVKEYYNQLTFPKEAYENYRSVINAAANFNKIVLVLEKTN